MNEPEPPPEDDPEDDPYLVRQDAEDAEAEADREERERTIRLARIYLGY